MTFVCGLQCDGYVHMHAGLSNHADVMYVMCGGMSLDLFCSFRAAGICLFLCWIMLMLCRLSCHSPAVKLWSLYNKCVCVYVCVVCVCV